MIPPFRRLRDCAFPDLLRLQDEYHRNQVWGMANKESGLEWFLPIAAYTPLLPWMYVAVNLNLSLVSMMLMMVPAFMVVSVSAQCFVVFLLHRKLDRSIWRQLRERGVLICTHCGYDLTGNTSGVCSECGREFGSSQTEPRP